MHKVSKCRNFIALFYHFSSEATTSPHISTSVMVISVRLWILVFVYEILMQRKNLLHSFFDKTTTRTKSSFSRLFKVTIPSCWKASLMLFKVGEGLYLNKVNYSSILFFVALIFCGLPLLCHVKYSLLSDLWHFFISSFWRHKKVQIMWKNKGKERTESS